MFRKYPTEPVDLFGKVSSEAPGSGSCHLILQDALPVLCSFKVVKNDFFFSWGGWHGTAKSRTDKGFFLLVRRKTDFFNLKDIGFTREYEVCPPSLLVS